MHIIPPSLLDDEVAMLADSFGFDVRAIDEIVLNGLRCSSSRIPQAPTGSDLPGGAATPETSSPGGVIGRSG